MILFHLLCVRIEIDSALVRELLSNISLFVGQLYADTLCKSFLLCARDLLCFTTDLQTVIYYLTIHC